MIEAAVRARLLGDATIAEAIGTRIYPQEAPENADLPRIVYNRISGQPSASLGGRSGLVKAQVEVNVHAASESDLASICVAVRKRLDVAAETIAGVNVQAIDVTDEQDEAGAVKGKDDRPAYSRRITADCWFRD